MREFFFEASCLRHDIRPHPKMQGKGNKGMLLLYRPLKIDKTLGQVGLVLVLAGNFPRVLEKRSNQNQIL